LTEHTSDQQYGTSHVVSKAEAKAGFEKECDLIMVGSGQEGNVRLSPEDEDKEYFAKKGCEVLLQPTQKSIRSFNRSAKRTIALMRVTCRAHQGGPWLELEPALQTARNRGVT